jgi:hypothetical protein
MLYLLYGTAIFIILLQYPIIAHITEESLRLIFLLASIYLIVNDVKYSISAPTIQCVSNLGVSLSFGMNKVRCFDEERSISNCQTRHHL